MNESGFEENTKEKRDAMVNCSKAILETIQSYGPTAALDFVVRISNHDDIVSAVLPYFASIARVAMLKPWNKGSDSQTMLFGYYGLAIYCHFFHFRRWGK